MYFDDELSELITGRRIYLSHSESIFDIKKIRGTQFHNKLHAHQLSKLEIFVRDVLRDDAVPFLPKIQADHDVGFDYTHLAERNFKLMPDFIDIVKLLSPRFQYNEHINVFMHCCGAIGLLNGPINWGSQDRGMNPSALIPAFGGICAGELFNDVVQRMRIEWREQGFGEKYRTRCSMVKKRITEYTNYEKALFNKWSRLIVLRLDLYYKKEFADEIGLQEAIDDLNHLIQNKRNNSIFRSMKGYIAKLEYGIDKGLHWHLIFFFDGAERHNACQVYFARQIGDYWVEKITAGRGDYWNCNAKENEFEALGIRGIGVINADQFKLRENLRNNVIGYLCKLDQYLKPIGSEHVHLIRKGQSPKLLPNKLGAPRTRHLKSVPALLEVDTSRAKRIQSPTLAFNQVENIMDVQVLIDDGQATGT
jgi:hypothetical protein